jgi:glycosyltransferase involved in cell wall biosynthesis
VTMGSIDIISQPDALAGITDVAGGFLKPPSSAFAKLCQKILIVMSAYDEQECIGDVLKEIKTLYPTLGLLVVDDGSVDRTGEIAREQGASVIRHAGNRGVTAAIQTARNYAVDHGYEYMVFCDADGQHKPVYIATILGPLIQGKADFVIGSRELGHYDSGEPSRLRIPRRICSMMTSAVMQKTLKDTTSGFKGWNLGVIKNLRTMYDTTNKLHLGTTNGIEEILLAHKAGFRIMEVPVVMGQRRGGRPKIYLNHNHAYYFTVFPFNLLKTIFRNLF